MPRFVDEINNITVEVGQDATFVCTVSEIHVRSSLIPIYSQIFPIQGIQSRMGESKEQGNPGSRDPCHHPQSKVPSFAKTELRFLCIE